MRKILMTLAVIVSAAVPVLAQTYREVYEVERFNYKDPAAESWEFGSGGKEVRFPLIFEKLADELYSVEIYYNGLKKYTLMGEGERHMDKDMECMVIEYPFIDYNKSSGTLRIYSGCGDWSDFQFIYNNMILSFTVGRDLTYP